MTTVPTFIRGEGPKIFLDSRLAVLPGIGYCAALKFPISHFWNLGDTSSCVEHTLLFDVSNKIKLMAGLSN